MQITFSGEESLVEYTFGRRTVYHGFCKVCGVAISERFDPPGRLEKAVNARTITGLDLSKLTIEKWNGKGVGPAFEG
jgi:hypothetical protein